MDSRANIILLVYYIGIASCAAQGAEKGKYDNSIPMLRYIANAFGGGFIRDVIILGVYPWLFTSSAFLDIILVVIIGLLYTNYLFVCNADKKIYNIVTQLVVISDAFGLGSFICIGMDKAFVYNSNIFSAIISGYVTAIGGGILASGKPFAKIFKNKETVCYHFITLIGCCYYYIFRHSLSLVYIVAVGLFLTNFEYKFLCILYHCNLITLCLEVVLFYPVIHNNNNIFQKQKNINVAKKLGVCPERPKIYLIQHRIRQC